MSQRLMAVIVFLVPLLALPAFFLLEAGTASNELAAVEQLEPQSAAQLSVLPTGQDVLIEGRLDLLNTRSLDPLLIYLAEDRYLDADLSGRWYASQVASPFSVALSDGVVRVINRDYVLKNPLHLIELSPVKRFSGLALGDRVTIIGAVTRDASGPAVQAKVVAGGTRAEYLAAQQRSAAAPVAIAAFLALLAVLLGLGLWLVRNQAQRYNRQNLKLEGYH